MILNWQIHPKAFKNLKECKGLEKGRECCQKCQLSKKKNPMKFEN